MSTFQKHTSILQWHFHWLLNPSISIHAKKKSSAKIDDLKKSLDANFLRILTFIGLDV